MAAYYFDTSAIVKRYLPETGSTWVRTITDTTNQRGRPIHSITVVSIGIVETVAAFARRHRMGQLDAAARQENVQGAFRCLDDRMAGRQVVLIDDLCTTGATLSACSVALREAGTSSVWAYTLARPRLMNGRKEQGYAGCD